MAYALTGCLNLLTLTRSLNILLLSLCVSIFGEVQAQLPTTNLYQFTFTRASGAYSLRSPRFLTHFNQEGYNNQPYFFGDDILYFTTDYYGNDQTDIASMDLFSNTLTRISYTKESEYSPAPVPGKQSFSCVRVEEDGVTQTLTLYPLDGFNFGNRILQNTDNLGYYAWLAADRLALFLLEKNNTSLAISEPTNEKRKIVLESIGRCLKTDRDGILYFVHKSTDNDWSIKSYDYVTNRLKLLVPCLEGIEDFELLNDGSILSAQESKLFVYDPDTSDSWTLVEDLEKYGISCISRIAVRKNKIVLVVSDNCRD